MNGVLVSTAGFMLIALALVFTEVSTRRRRGKFGAQSLGLTTAVSFTELIRGIAALPGGRAVLLASWCWVAWHLLAR